MHSFRKFWSWISQSVLTADTLCMEPATGTDSWWNDKRFAGDSNHIVITFIIAAKGLFCQRSILIDKYVTNYFAEPCEKVCNKTKSARHSILSGWPADLFSVLLVASLSSSPARTPRPRPGTSTSPTSTSRRGRTFRIGLWWTGSSLPCPMASMFATLANRRISHWCTSGLSSTSTRRWLRNS